MHITIGSFELEVHLFWLYLKVPFVGECFICRGEIIFG